MNLYLQFEVIIWNKKDQKVNQFINLFYDDTLIKIKERHEPIQKVMNHESKTATTKNVFKI